MSAGPVVAYPALRLDGWLPRWDAVERHSIALPASAEHAWPVVRAMDFRASLVVRTLMALRSIPALFSRAGGGAEALGCDVEGLLRSGFVLLEEHPGQEVILGLVGRFWTPSGGVQRVTPDEFRAWTRPALPARSGTSPSRRT